MAAGFSVLDSLNKNSKAGLDESPKARFRTKDISIFKMYRNKENFYEINDIEKLAAEILMVGLMENLSIVYAPSEKGEYKIIGGERRWEALKLLVSKGYTEFEIATCQIRTPVEQHEENIEIIISNSQREKTIKDILEEEKRLKESLEYIRDNNLTIKGYDVSKGRLRDIIADMLKLSKTKVAQIENINNNLIPEFKKPLIEERITFSAAAELAGMKENEQQELYEQYQEKGEITHKEVVETKEELKKIEEVSETAQIHINDSPEYLPKEYEDERTKIPQNNLNKAVEKEIKQVVHELKTASMFYLDVANKFKRFELRKNDRNYKVGDILKLMEYKDGEYTGRELITEVIYILDDYTGIVEGFCILGLGEVYDH